MRGVYQYFRPLQDPTAQANILLDESGRALLADAGLAKVGSAADGAGAVGERGTAGVGGVDCLGGAARDRGVAAPATRCAHTRERRGAALLDAAVGGGGSSLRPASHACGDCSGAEPGQHLGGAPTPAGSR